MDQLPSTVLHTHVIKITALVTAVCCGTYMFWQTFIKGRPNIGGRNANDRDRQHPRRQRRIYANDGTIPNLTRSGISVITLRSDEYIQYPVRPQVVRRVKPVLSCVTRDQMINDKSKINLSKQKVSTSRDLKPGRKRPISALVGGRFHKLMPGNDQVNAPAGYAPVHTNQGRVLWHRLPSMMRPQQQWFLQPPFIRNWNNSRRRETLQDRLQFLFMPIRAVPAVEQVSEVNLETADAEPEERELEMISMNTNTADDDIDWDFLDHLDDEGFVSEFDQTDADPDTIAAVEQILNSDSEGELAADTTLHHNRSAPLYLIVRREILASDESESLSEEQEETITVSSNTVREQES